MMHNKVLSPTFYICYVSSAPLVRPMGLFRLVYCSLVAAWKAFLNNYPHCPIQPLPRNNWLRQLRADLKKRTAVAVHFFNKTQRSFLETDT